jgi:hypothetical protein
MRLNENISKLRIVFCMYSFIPFQTWLKDEKEKNEMWNVKCDVIRNERDRKKMVKMRYEMRDGVWV